MTEAELSAARDGISEETVADEGYEPKWVLLQARALLAHVDVQAAEVARLREAALAVVDESTPNISPSLGSVERLRAALAQEVDRGE